MYENIIIVRAQVRAEGYKGARTMTMHGGIVII
jgi:hypothetical protein